MVHSEKQKNKSKKWRERQTDTEKESERDRERETHTHTHTQNLHECMKWPILVLLWWAWSSDSSSPGGEVPAAADEASSELMLDCRVSAFSLCNAFKVSSADARLSRSLSLFTLQSWHKLILLSYKYSSLWLLQFCRWCVRVWLRCFPAVATKSTTTKTTKQVWLFTNWWDFLLPSFASSSASSSAAASSSSSIHLFTETPPCNHN